jgi:hypothetical protein
MRNRFSHFHGLTERWRLSLCFLLLSLPAINVFSQTPPNVDKPGRPTSSEPQLDKEEAQARAWLAKMEEEHAQFKKVAEGTYIITSNTDVKVPAEPSECHDVWTLQGSGNGEFQVDGMFSCPDSNSKGYSFPYQVKLDHQLRLAAYKIFGTKLVSGCVRTKSKLFCQETDREGRLQGTTGASIDNSTQLLSPDIIPFLFIGLTANSKIHSGETTYLTLLSLVTFDEPGETIALFPAYGSLSSIHPRTYSVQHANLHGAEFQLAMKEIPHAAATTPQSPVIPPDVEHKDQYRPFLKFVISSNGILLSATDLESNKEFIRLVQFRKLADF